MSYKRVLQYEFLLDKQDKNKRFVVRAYLSYHVLRCLPWQTRLALLRHYSDRFWFEDVLPLRVSEWLWSRLAPRSSREDFREQILEYLRFYTQQYDPAHPLAFENRIRQFLVARQEERFSLKQLLADKETCADKKTWDVYVFAPGNILAPSQVFLMSA